MSTSNPGENWKDRMFRLHANEFVQIANARPASANFRSIFGRSRSRKERFSVLDLGCGSGRFLEPLSRFATLVVGLDYSPELLTYAASASRRLNNVVLIRGDARELNRTFVEGEFDAVFRAFTSLGYFARETEKEILQQCAFVTRSGGKLLVDCFNRTWFETNRRISRSTSLDGFTLQEEYEWDEGRAAVSCTWRYLRPADEPIEIPFTLDGYGKDDVVQLLQSSGWRVTEFLEDLVTCKRIDDPSALERLVAVAERV